MYCIARQCVLPPLGQEQAEQLLTKVALQSLAHVFEAVPDPRGAHGLRYDLPFFLTCLVAALLCNCDGSEAVAQWCRDQRSLLRRVFGPRRFLTPSGSLYRWLLPQVDACALERVLGRWIQATTLASADEPLALDGKTRRGPEQGSRLLPICWPSGPIRARKRSCRCGWTRKPTRSGLPSRCCPRCPCGSGSVRPMPCTPTPSSRQGHAPALAGIQPRHWHIENRSHYVRDVTFGEDRSRWRTGNAPQILATLRNLAITLIHRFGSSHIAATRRHFASCPHQALALLVSRKGGQQ